MGDGIKGLIYTGGESSRMGLDKGGLYYYGIPQREYLAGLVSKFIGVTFLSCHPARVPQSEYSTILDVYDHMGPMGGLLSAFLQDPDSAWLTVPCDMPLVDVGVIEELLMARDSEHMATCFEDPESGLPEPLFVIWETSVLPFLMRAKDGGQFSLRKLLVSIDCKRVYSDFPGKLRNVNTREEYEEVMKLIGKK